MSNDPPDVPDLIQTVSEFIDGITSKLDGQDRYHALCALYLLEIAQRELADWHREETTDDARLRAFADLPDVPAESLAWQLSTDIRKGKFDHRMDELLNTLVEHVAAKVKVSKPSHLDSEHG